MNSITAQSVLSFLALVLIASFVGALIYFILRCLEKESYITTQLASFLVLISSLVFIVNPTSKAIRVLPFYLLAVVVGSIGIVFHQKSSFAPKNIFACFSLMSTATLLNLIASTLLFESSHLSNAVLRKIEGQFGFFFWFLIAAQSLTTPFFIWVWKSYRLRPGMDKHLES